MLKISLHCSRHLASSAASLKRLLSKLACVLLACLVAQAPAIAASAPGTSSGPLGDVRSYADFTVIHDLSRERDGNVTPETSYGGINVSATVMQDSTPAVTHLFITSAECSPLKEVTKEICVVVGGDYYVKTTVYVETAIRTISNGAITGLLAIPFKYHFGDHAATSGATLGGYVGFQRDWSYIGSAAWIIGGGLAMVPTSTATTVFTSTTGTPAGTTPTTTSTTTTADSSLYGITIATGLIGKIGQTNIQFGVLIGADLVNKKENYKYDGRPWLSFSFGYAFAK